MRNPRSFRIGRLRESTGGRRLDPTIPSGPTGAVASASELMLVRFGFDRGDSIVCKPEGKDCNRSERTKADHPRPAMFDNAATREHQFASFRLEAVLLSPAWNGVNSSRSCLRARRRRVFIAARSNPKASQVCGPVSPSRSRMISTSR